MNKTALYGVDLATPLIAFEYFYSLDPTVYEQHLKKYGFEILLKERDQDQHLVWIAKKNG